jgi:predicted RNA polymerase sigma factor
MRTVNDLKSINSINSTLSANEYKSKLSSIQKDMEYKVGQDVQATLVSLGKLEAMGKLDSIEAVQKARADLLGQLKGNYEAYTQTYLPAMEKVMQNAREEAQYYREQGKFSSDITMQV